MFSLTQLYTSTKTTTTTNTNIDLQTQKTAHLEFPENIFAFKRTL